MTFRSICRWAMLAASCFVPLATVTGCSIVDGSPEVVVNPGGPKVDGGATPDATPQASASDGLKNGSETDVDCGGPGAPPCHDGKMCKQGSDCVNHACTSGVCTAPSPTDGVKNGTETGIDCGGPGSIPRCPVGQGCTGDTDCAGDICRGGLCRDPGPTDGILNNGETDVDCGGPNAPKCKQGSTCVVHADCQSDGCGYDSKCASNRSCTRLEGGTTCGPNDGMGAQDDCCKTAKVGPYTIEKYQITAGRMRTFIERMGGNVRAWAQTLPASTGWSQAWTPELPSTVDEANEQLGPYYDKRACNSGFHTGHTYWTPAPFDEGQEFPQDVNDMKALNCTPWWLTKALCVWSGGHMITAAELRAAYTNNNTTSYPWGALGGYTTTAANPYAVGVYSYETPDPPPLARFDETGFYDAVYYVAPPGRRPVGYSSTGVADLVGNLLEWVGDRDRQFVWKGSWENHAAEADGFNPGVNDPYSEIRNGQYWIWGTNIGIGRPGDGRGVGYYGIGSRCAF
ncbi:MAG: hypothetical protein U0174_25130 [Polyangiaceae bacterium]